MTPETVHSREVTKELKLDSGIVEFVAANDFLLRDGDRQMTSVQVTGLVDLPEAPASPVQVTMVVEGLVDEATWGVIASQQAATVSSGELLFPLTHLERFLCPRVRVRWALTAGSPVTITPTFRAACRAGLPEQMSLT